MHKKSALSSHALTRSPSTGIPRIHKKQCANGRIIAHIRSWFEIVLVFRVNDLLALTLNHLSATGGSRQLPLKRTLRLSGPSGFA